MSKSDIVDNDRGQSHRKLNKGRRVCHRLNYILKIILTFHITLV